MKGCLKISTHFPQRCSRLFKLFFGKSLFPQNFQTASSLFLFLARQKLLSSFPGALESTGTCISFPSLHNQQILSSARGGFQKQKPNTRSLFKNFQEIICSLLSCPIIFGRFSLLSRIELTNWLTALTRYNLHSLTFFAKSIAFAWWPFLPIFKMLSFFEYQLFFPAVFCIEQLQCVVETFLACSYAFLIFEPK